MTVVDSYIGGKKLDPSEYSTSLSTTVRSLLIEGIAQNSTGSVLTSEPNSEVHIHWKGAAEIVLASCTSFVDADGSEKPMSEDKATYFMNSIGDMAASSLRCIAIAYRLFDINNIPKGEDQLVQWSLPENDLVLLAILGLKQLPVDMHAAAADCMSLEATCRVNDPVYGCARIIEQLQQQISMVEAELARTRCEIAFYSAQQVQQQQQEHGKQSLFKINLD